MNTPSELGTVIVTGGAAGLGAAVVRAVADAGGTPAVLDLHAPDDPAIAFERVDLADAGAAAEAVERLVERVGPPSGVVTAAGIDSCGPLAQVPFEDWSRVVAVNLVGTAAVIKACLPHLERTHGRIVTVASTLGLRAVGDATAYCASKYGVVGFTQALARELAGRIGVTLLVPGGMQTGFFDGRPDQYRPGPDADLADPAHVARAVLFALGQPPGLEVRQLTVTTGTEPSWP